MWVLGAPLRQDRNVSACCLWTLLKRMLINIYCCDVSVIFGRQKGGEILKKDSHVPRFF